MEHGGPGRLEIGATLKQTRQRLGLEIREIEERTKIRIKYLRALENEEWDVLPAPAYVRGFLRAYADLLELDGEVLADEYRRQFEEIESQAAQGVGGVLSERRRDARTLSAPRWPLLGGIGAVLVIVIVILAIASGSDDGGAEMSESAVGVSQGDESTGGEVRLAIVAETDIEVCVLDADETPLIDGRLLIAGTRENLGRSERFAVEIGEGRARLIVDGEPRQIELDDPATYEITAAGISSLPDSAPGCP